MSDGTGASAPAVSLNPSTPTSTPTNGAPKPGSAETTPVPSFKGVKHRVKVDGQELEVEHDQLLRDYQTKAASDKRFREAAQTEKQAKELLSALESGDVKFIEKKLGKAKAKELFENYLIDDLEYEQLPDSEKRARQLETENKSLKQQREADEKAHADREYKSTLEKAHKDLDTEVHQALAELGKKPTPRMAMRVVDEMIIRLEGKKQEKISAKDASTLALKGIHADIKEYLPGLSVQELREILPQEVIDLLRQDEVEKVTGQLSQRRVKPTAPTKRTPDKPKSLDDWYETKLKKLKGR